MNPLFAAQCAAGQKLHEELYGARFRIFDMEIPCAHSKVVQNAESIIGGQTTLLMVESITFLAEHFQGTKPDKDVFCDLLPPHGTQWIPLKLGPGGLTADGLKYEFTAYARNYGA